MKRYFFFLSGASLLLLGSCSMLDPLGAAGGTTTASGTVIDQNTGQIIPNATVEVGNLNGYWLTGGNAPTTQADANGHFSLQFDADADHSYTLFAYTKSGYSSSYGYNEKLKNGRQNDNLSVRAAAPAWVRVKCVDDAPASRSWLELGGVYVNPDGSTPKQYIGPGDFSLVLPAYAYRTDSDIYYRLSDEQATIREGHLPFYVTNFDTATVTIHF